MDDQNNIRLDLALSGGGVRASFFSLGVVMYLLDSGLHQRVSVVSSVSGGSIANAALAMSQQDFANGSAARIQEDIRRFASHLAENGPFFVKQFKLQSLFLLVNVVGVASLYLYSILALPGIFRNSLLNLQAWAVMLTSLLFILVSWWNRRGIQIKIYERFLGSAKRGPTTTPGATRIQGLLDRTRLIELPESSTVHIFCATELVSGTPILMSREWTYSVAYGWSRLPLRLSEVMYASAAFPVVFPPLPVHVDPSEWSGGERVDRPQKMRLADGGVYNNLGTDWTRLLGRASATFDGVDKRFSVPPAGNVHVIVNASAPPRVASLGGLWLVRGIRAFVRIMTVMYENTVRPRLENLQQNDQCRTVVIDITDSPLSAADQILQDPGDAEVKLRAGEMIEALKNNRPPNYWNEYNQKAARVKTTLDSVGKQQAAQLLRHGYLSATVVLHSYFGCQGIAKLPDDRWFYNFLEHPHKGPVTRTTAGTAEGGEGVGEAVMA